ncbi:MAG TPA: endonuclease III [Candidatus Methylomirabilis sp.]|nr:endonuclease III [Candidatus Methylomirabilis sp.]HSD52041.1 endonuclease III [Candidatus Methylomirabilis sp.]
MPPVGKPAARGAGRRKAFVPPTMAKLGKILEILTRAYPDARCELNFSTPLELLVATILSAQCTDARVNQVTPHLFRKYRSANAYANADPMTFEQEIRTTGFFRSKAKNIIACCQKLVQVFGGQVPRAMEDLVTLPGVGRKTANILLYNGYGIPGFAVDTHVARVTGRLGLVDTEDPVKIEETIGRAVPRETWGQATHLFIFHGRRTCHAKQPRCPECTLRSLCPWPGKR